MFEEQTIYTISAKDWTIVKEAVEVYLNELENSILFLREDEVSDEVMERILQVRKTLDMMNDLG